MKIEKEGVNINNFDSLLIMKEREYIIKYFRDKGYEAFARDWSLGESVGIPWGKEEVDRDGVVIIVWREIVYIFFRDGVWHIHSPFLGEQIKLNSLEDAIAKAESVLTLVKNYFSEQAE